MAVEDDTVPESYPYLWNSDSSISVLDFLTKVCDTRLYIISKHLTWGGFAFLFQYKPSMVQDDGTKPVRSLTSPPRATPCAYSSMDPQWLWVQKSPLAENVDAESTATEEAAEYCKIPLYHGKIRAGIHGVSVKEVTEKIESIKVWNPALIYRSNEPNT